MSAVQHHALHIRRLIASAICLALALDLPYLTGQLQPIGNMLCPMHIPVLLCGFLCGWPWGLAVGFLAPLLRSALFGMPLFFPIGISMAFELAAYGAIAGILHRTLSPRPVSLYICLLTAMAGGRLLWGCVRFLLAGLDRTEFPFSAFLAGAFTNAIPGILLQFLLIPPLVMALDRAGLCYNNK